MLNVLRQASIVGVVAIGMTFVIATGGIDLSVGSMLAACRVAGGQFVDSGSLMFILGALGMGILLGGVNAAAIAYGRVVPFIATLAMFTMARGLALWISDKTPISVFDLESVRWFGTGEIIGIPSAIFVFLGVTAFGWVLLNRTRYGRYVVAVGGNREAARIAGVKVQRIIFSVYVLSGICVAIAAVLLVGRLSSASPVAGNLLELDAIAAVVIGGTALAGGRATIVGTFLGVLTFALIFNLLTIMNMAVEIQQVTKGVDHPRRRASPAQAATRDARQQRKQCGALSNRRRESMMFERRIAASRAVLLRWALAACGGDDSGDSAENSDTAQNQPAQAAAEGSGGPSRSPSACPAADHGWLKAVSDNAKAGRRGTRRQVELTINDSATSSAEQADQIETLINEQARRARHPPVRGRRADPGRAEGDGGRHPGRQRRPRVLHARRVPDVDRRRQLRHRLAGGQLLRRRAQVPGQRRRDPGPGRHLRHRGSLEGLRRRAQAAVQGRIKVVASQPADFAPDKGLSVMENILQAQKRDRRRVHARRRHGRGRRGGDRERRPRGRDVPHRRRRLEGGHGAHRGGRPVPRDVPLQPDDVGVGGPPREPDRATARA